MTDSSFLCLAKRDHFLMHGIVSRRFPALCVAFLVAFNAVFLNLASRDF